MLDQVLGPGQAVVRLTAEVNFDAVQETSEKFDPKNAVVRSETITNENNVSKTESVAGVAGATANTEGNSKSSAGPQTTSQQQRENTVNQYEISRTVETRQRLGGDVRRLTIAVMVNMRKAAAAATGALAQATPRTPQEIKAIEDIVKASVGFTREGLRRDEISVQEVPFTDLFADAGVPAAQPSVKVQMSAWLPYVTQGFLVLLAVGILFYMRGLLKENVTADNRPGGEFSAILRRLEETEEAIHEQSGRRNGHRSDALTVDELSKLIREHPNNTSLAIKQWMNRN
jgi:flagellar M-ring protein FliF